MDDKPQDLNNNASGGGANLLSSPRRGEKEPENFIAAAQRKLGEAAGDLTNTLVGAAAHVDVAHKFTEPITPALAKQYVKGRTIVEGRAASGIAADNISGLSGADAAAVIAYQKVHDSLPAQIPLIDRAALLRHAESLIEQKASKAVVAPELPSAAKPARGVEKSQSIAEVKREPAQPARSKRDLPTEEGKHDSSGSNVKPSETRSKPEPRKEGRAETKLENKSESKSETRSDLKLDSRPESKLETKSENKSVTEQKSEVKTRPLLDLHPRGAVEKDCDKLPPKPHQPASPQLKPPPDAKSPATEKPANDKKAIASEKVTANTGEIKAQAKAEIKPFVALESTAKIYAIAPGPIVLRPIEESQFFKALTNPAIKSVVFGRNLAVDNLHQGAPALDVRSPAIAVAPLSQAKLMGAVPPQLQSKTEARTGALPKAPQVEMHQSNLAASVQDQKTKPRMPDKPVSDSPRDAGVDHSSQTHVKHITAHAEQLHVEHLSGSTKIPVSHHASEHPQEHLSKYPDAHTPENATEHPTEHLTQHLTQHLADHLTDHLTQHLADHPHATAHSVDGRSQGKTTTLRFVLKGASDKEESGDKYITGTEFAFVAIMALASTARAKPGPNTAEDGLRQAHRQFTMVEENLWPITILPALDFVRSDLPLSQVKDAPPAPPARSATLKTNSQTIVRPQILAQTGDDLCKMADSLFYDERLGHLIADLNADRITSTYEHNARVVVIRTRQKLSLPAHQDIVEYADKLARVGDIPLITMIETSSVDQELLTERLAPMLGINSPNRDPLRDDN